MSQYSEKVMEHFRNPHNVGEMENPDGIGHVGNAICGDIMELYIKVKDGIITDAKFKTFGCLPANEEVVAGVGDWVRVPDIAKRATVINSNGEQTEVAETYTRDFCGKICCIEPFVSPYNAFAVTPNHPVLCLQRTKVKGARKSGPKCDWLRMGKKELLGTDPDFIRADQLKVGDYLLFTVNKTVKDNPFFTVDIMKLMGYYLSEGYIIAKGNAVAFAFNKNETDLIRETKDLLGQFCGKEAKSRTRDNVTEVYICSRKLVSFLVKYCGKLACHKKLAEEIITLPFEKQWHLVEKYLLGDGDSYKRRTHNSDTYRMITTSKLLAVQLQEILARGGNFSSIRKIYKTNCVIEGRKLKDSEQYLVSFKMERNHRFVHFNGRKFLVPIRKIETLDYSGKVYNFQVASEPNTYLVKGFAVHNCGAAIATSSMVTDMVKGKTIPEALVISNKAVAEALGGLPPVKMHCSVLAEQALKSAIDDYYKKIGKPSPVNPDDICDVHCTK